MRRLCALAAVLAAGAALVAQPARGDADPASDILLGQNVFLPFFGPKPSDASKTYLADVVDAANRDGYQIRVATIGDRRDLGGVFSLYGKPKTYAPFLGRELAFVYRGRLLVSMPAGFGFYWNGRPVARERRILDGVPVRPGVDGLVDSTADAVKALAAANGHTIAVEKSSGGGGGGVPTRLIIAVAGALVLAALILVPVLLRRRRGAAA